jgi:hypothetical protein
VTARERESRGACHSPLVGSPPIRSRRAAVPVWRAHGRGAACYGAGMSLFDPDAFGPGPGDRVIERPRRAGELRQIWRWVRREHWTVQIVLMLGAVTIAALVFVFGLLVGAGIAPWLGGYGPG